MGWNRVKYIPGGGVYPADGHIKLGSSVWGHKTWGGTFPIYTSGTPAIVFIEKGAFGRGWNPTEVIADAMCVVEQLVQEGWTFHVVYERGHAHAIFRKMDSNDLPVSANAIDKELPMAICLAALSTLRIKYAKAIRRLNKITKHKLVRSVQPNSRRKGR